jgi:polar amino acid transport system substrate-binding protein
MSKFLRPRAILNILHFAVTLLACGFAQAGSSAFLPSPTLENIRARGEVTIGVKSDLAPFGSVDTSGKPIGMEIELAKKIADALNVRLVTKGVSAENRFQRLEQGNIDILLATAADTKERRSIATAIEPNYYAESVNVLLPKNTRAREWSDIRGQTLCALQGAYFNKPISQRHIIELQMYRNVRDAEMALRDQRCSGFLYTNSALQYLIKQPEWSDYVLTLPPSMNAPWAIYLNRSEKGTELDQRLGNLVGQWHRDQTLIKLESTWGLQPTPFLQQAHLLWNQKDAAGHYVCQRNSSGEWPVECRNKAFVTSEQVSGITGFGLWIKETLGLPLSIIYDPFDAQRYVFGALWTLALSAFSILGALLLGYWGAQRIITGSRLTNGIVKLIANFARMTPPLLQMYLVFFGLGGLLHNAFDITLSPFLVAVWALSFYHGGMIVFTFLESARLKQKSAPDFRLTLANLPSLIEHSAIGLRTAVNNLTKATTIASAIAVPELLTATIAIIADQGNADVMMNLLLIVFYLLSAMWLSVVFWVERRVILLSQGGR